MSEILKKKDSDQLVKVLARHGEEIWVTSYPEDDTAWTTMAKFYEDYKPEVEVGDVWQHPGGDHQYVAVGVDTKRGQWHMIRKAALSNPYGEKVLTKGANGAEGITKVAPQGAFSNDGTIYTRPYPESRMELVERPA